MQDPYTAPTSTHAPNPTQPPRKPSGCGKAAAGTAIGCVVLVGLGVVVVLAFVFWFGYGIETGRYPSDQAQSELEISSELLGKLREAEIIGPDERVLYFYSQALLDALDTGCLFTPERVLAYRTDEGEPTIASATWVDIERIELQDFDSLLDDSLITVYLEDGSWIECPVAGAGNGDSAFYEKLDRTWKRATGRSTERYSEESVGE